MTAVPSTTYNAFSSASAQGNPAGVIILPQPDKAITHDANGNFPYELFPPASKLQEIATALDLPMTAFALPLNLLNESSETPQYAVRWFNLTNEAPLCGHATLALSHHLFNAIPDPPKTLRYLTRLHGVVSASLYQSPFEDAKLVGIEFPELVLSPVTRESSRWGDIKGVFDQASNPRWEGEGEPVGVFEQKGYLLIEYSPDLDLKALQIESQKLVSLGASIYMFQISKDSSEHIHSRVYNTYGDKVPEDIATGSAHRAIVPHALSHPETLTRLKQYHPEFKGNTVRSLQQSKEGGELTVEWIQDSQSVRIMGRVTRVGESNVEI
ncbi:phenazine biosynthesis [Fusarium heterosporum]|uniref:Phenazine biosynthesis n=1 Tax=Fusarium heterosporum TaxID=42747 RepID=A0A8H5WPY6_FUSHE|nr:phenazine biosynthesis [Fusarium heterosporum]